MTLRAFAALGLLVLAACAPIQSETRSTIVVDGSSYVLRTQTVAGRNGPFERTSVIVQNHPVTCLADSPGDCEAAARDARSSSNGD